jgi:hypothetical protein
MSDEGADAIHPMKRVFRILGIVALALMVLLAAYITTSKGVDYIHGFGKACAVFHSGWHIHGQCGVTVPPGP